MKKLRKALSLLLAGITAVTAMLCGSVSASAASSKTALLKTAITQIDSKATDIIALGQDLYLLYNDTYDAVYRIGSDEIKNWRSKGKLKATKITVDSEVAKLLWMYNNQLSFDYGDYAVWYVSNSDKTTTRYIMKYDKANKRITKVYSAKNNIGVSFDGTMSEFIWDEGKRKLSLKILNNKAKPVKQLDYDLSGDTSAAYSWFKYGSKYAVVTYWKNNDLNASVSLYDAGHFIVIDTKGKSKTINTYCTTSYVSGKNYIAYAKPAVGYFSDVYLTDKNKTYNIDEDITWFTLGSVSDDTFFAQYYDIIGFGDGFYGTKAIAEYRNSETNEYAYALVNVSSNKFLSAKYNYMNTKDDGGTYLVQDFDGRGGFLDSKGKKLKMFDIASEFCGKGKYAPVIKNGKIYLVDKNMKQVSKTIKADDNSYLNTLGDELFMYTYGGKTYLMTNKK